MPNVSGNAYSLNILSPVRNGLVPGQQISHADAIRDQLQGWNTEFNSPMALVPQTYLCRFYILDDVVIQSLPGGSAPDTLADWSLLESDKARRGAMPAQDHLQSAYLVFTSNFYCGQSGSPEPYLKGMWESISGRIRHVWQHCYGFEEVQDARSFIAYMRRCQLETSLFFVGSNDKPLEEQLKALYLKQEFSRFALEHQGLAPAALRQAYLAFMQRVQAENLHHPSWHPGQYRL